MKGVSPLLAAVLIIAVTVSIATLVTGWISTVTRSTQATTENRTAQAVVCTSANINIEDVYVTAADPGTARIIAKNTGYTNGLSIMSAQLYDKLGNNFTSTASLPLTDFDVGDIETLSFQFTDMLDYTNDSSSYGNNATLGYFSSDDSSEPAYNLSGYRGSALAFDGVNDFANVSDSNSLDLAGTFTLSAWINTKGNLAAAEIISKVDAGPTNGYRLRLLGNNSVSFELVDAAGIDSRNGTALVSNATWTHVAATNSNGTMIIYRNGDIINSSTSLVIPRAGTSQLHIGSAPIVVANFFNGTIDEVAIWNRTLNGAEINISKNVGPTVVTNTNDLVLYLRFNEGRGIFTCPADFSRAVITTNCGGISAEWTKPPKC